MHSFQFCICPTFFHFQNFLLIIPPDSSKTKQVSMWPTQASQRIPASWTHGLSEHKTQAGTSGSFHRDRKRCWEGCSLLWRLWVARTLRVWKGCSPSSLPHGENSSVHGTNTDESREKRKKGKERWCLLRGYWIQRSEDQPIVFSDFGANGFCFFNVFNFVWVSLS